MFFYTYDFGDGWEHSILVEKILPKDPKVSYPLCLKTKRACPPEDCGGAWGYMEFLEAIQNPQHPEPENFSRCKFFVDERVGVWLASDIR